MNKKGENHTSSLNNQEHPPKPQENNGITKKALHNKACK